MIGNTEKHEWSSIQEHQKSLGREIAVQFLYQCECEKVFYFPRAQFTDFITHFKIPERAVKFAHKLAETTLKDLPRWDQAIDDVSEHWRVNRMPLIDRSILRMATTELTEGSAPPAVVLNEAIELAKKYGTENSGRFVNGILDRLSIKTPARQIN